jgi:hypothetical protein
MLKSARESSPHHLLVGNKDKIARRMTQHQVRTRSKVIRRLARIGSRVSKGNSSGKFVPSLRPRG